MRFVGNYLYIKTIILIGFIFLFSSVISPRILFQIEDFNNKQDSFSENLKIAANSGRIYIANNWSDAVDSGICSGSGTFSDPYIIQDLIIDGDGTGIGILIGNSKNVFFRIENCTIFNCTYGIRLAISCNGTLMYNNCSYNENGIYLDGWIDIPHPPQEIIEQCYCMNNTISNNTINNNEDYGIFCRGGHGGLLGDLENNIIKGNNINNNRLGIYFQNFGINNTILDNNLINNKEYGISLDGPCYNNTIKGNKMKSCGFYSHYSYFLINTIDTTNLVNDGHLYFYANSTGLDNDDFSNAGQMYLVNCNNSIISNLDLSDGTVSMSLTNCSDIEISYNNLSSNNWWGIDLFNCVNLSIIENDINGNSIGIKGGLTNSIILGNEVNFNLEEGIYMSLSNNNSISKNNINSNGFRAGIRMFGYCSDNLISNNRFKNNFWEGLSLALYSSNNTITGNVFKSNRIGVGFDFSCSNNAFYLNFFINSEESHVSGPHITNTWNTTDIGNYWDNYTGSDNDGDGIGDIPHIISLSPLIIDYLPIVDNDPPIITIMKPINNSKIGSLAPSFNIRVEEKYLDVMWYTLDGGLNNYTFIENGTINQGAWDALNYGQITIRFYAVDKVGYISFMDVVVVKKLPETELIPGYNLFVLFCVISIIGVILVSIRRKSYSLLKKI